MGKFVSLNGWSPDRDLADMLAHAGTRSSAGDLDARPDDPRFFPSASKGKSYQVALQEVRAAATALYGRKRTVDELFGDEKLAAETALVAGTLLAVARQTTNKDVVVVFGRDFYPAQAFLRVWAKQLRGTWVYADCVTRHLAWRCAEWIGAEVKRHLRPGGRVFGVDTGWGGSVPNGSLHKLAAEGIEARVVLASSHVPERRAFPRIDRLDASLCNGGVLHDVACGLEDAEKAFLRAVELEDGKPVCRLPDAFCLVKASIRYMVAWQMAISMAPRLGAIFADPDFAPESVLALPSEFDALAWLDEV